MYQDPYVFNPDRILLDGELHPAGKNRFRLRTQVCTHYRSYSRAIEVRRVCPGRHVVTSTLWIAVASVLAAFDIKLNNRMNMGLPCSGEKNHVVATAKSNITHTLRVCRSPSSAPITPRSTEAAALIRATACAREIFTQVCFA
jgi:hypothetical protein